MSLETMAMPRVLVSVDFDFSVWLPQDERVVTLATGDGRELHGTAAEIFDFGHGNTEFYSEHIWEMRRRGFAAHGVSLEQLVTLRADHDTPTIPAFCRALEQRLGDARAPAVAVGVHDHHHEALRFLAEHVGHVDQIISFDAHHDLGYGQSDLQRAAEHAYGVGAWLYGALREGLADRVTVVYPDWRGLWEWRALEHDITSCQTVESRTGSASCATASRSSRGLTGAPRDPTPASRRACSSAAPRDGHRRGVTRCLTS